MNTAKKYIYTSPPKVSEDTTVQKAEIEKMKKVITEKIKDPALAKKAALIISEMIQNK